MNSLIKIICSLVIIYLFKSILLAENGYEIVLKKQIGLPMSGREKTGQINPTLMTLSSDGNLFILEEYDNHFKLLKSDLNFNMISEITIPREKMETKKVYESPLLTPVPDGGLLLQSVIQYQNEKKTEFFYLKKVLHINNSLKIINDFKTHQNGLILPPSKVQKNFYYILGNATPLTEKKAFSANYLFKIDNQGFVVQEIKMKNQIISDFLFYIINLSIITSFNKNEYITISDYDLSDSISYNELLNNRPEKSKNNICIYKLSPDNKTFKKEINLTHQIKTCYEKINKHPLNNYITLDGINYNQKTANVIFMMWEFDRFTTCGNIVSKHLINYNIKRGKLKMVNLGSRFFKRTYIAGYLNDICYVFDWNASILYGLKLK